MDLREELGSCLLDFPSFLPDQYSHASLGFTDELDGPISEEASSSPSGYVLACFGEIPLIKCMGQWVR